MTKPTSPVHAPPSERPFLRSHSRQIAQVRTPPSVSVQQSPHTGRAHDAHGPTASLEQNEQRVGESPEACWSSPLMSEQPSQRAI